MQRETESDKRNPDSDAQAKRPEQIPRIQESILAAVRQHIPPLIAIFEPVTMESDETSVVLESGKFGSKYRCCMWDRMKY